MEFTRRGFLKALGIGAGAGAAAAVTAPLALAIEKGGVPVLNPKAEVLKKGAPVKVTDCSSLERTILEAMVEKASKWPEGHLVHTINEVDVVTLKTGEVLLNCSAGAEGGDKEAFSVTFPTKPTPVGINQQTYDLMTQIDRWQRGLGRHMERSWENVRQDRKDQGNRHNFFTFRNLKRKVKAMNRDIVRATRAKDGRWKLAVRRKVEKD